MSRNKTPAILFVAILLASLLAMIVPSANAASFGDMGTKVTESDTDFVPTLTTTFPTGVSAFLGQRAVTAQYTAWYLHFGASGDTQIEQGKSFRLTCGTADTSCPTNAAHGKWVRAGDTDLAVPSFNGALVAFTARVKYLESDGRPGWTFGDGLYVDTDNNGNIDADDVRLIIPTGFSCSTCPLGRDVEAGDTDLTKATSTDREHPLTAAFATGTFTLNWFDGHNDGAIGFTDVFYLKGPNAPSAGANSIHPDVGDARITELASNAFSGTVDYGTLVQSGHTDYKRTVSLLTPRLALANGPAAGETDKTKQHLVLHFADPDGTENHLRYGDLFLYKGPSGGSAGTLITSAQSNVATSPGHGTGIDDDKAFAGQLRYHDLAPTGYSADDPIYLKHSLNTAGSVEIGDLRITPRLSFAAGTMVKSGDADIGNTLVADTNLVIKRYNNDGGNEVKLNTLSNVFRTSGGGTNWAPATEGLYICSGTPTTVADCQTRLRGPNGSPAATTITCPGDADCGTNVASYTQVSVTGPDSTWDQASSEAVYDRTIATRLTVGDVRVTAVGGLAAGSTVAAGDADITSPAIESSDHILVSYDPTAGNNLPFFRVGDVFLFGSTFGTRVTHSTTGFVPTLTEYTGALHIVRFNRDDPGSAQDDTYYAALRAATTLATNDIRITPISSTDPAGTLIKSGDSNFVQEVSGGSSFTRDSTSLRSRVCFIDVDGRAGLSEADPVYLIMDNAEFGAPFSSTTTAISPYDLRVTPYPATGTKTHDPGTIIVAGNNDLSSGQTTCATPPTGQSWFFRYFDQNLNNVFDASGTAQTDNDVAYLVLGTSKNHAPPPLHSVRFTGAGGSSTTVSTTPTTGGGGTTTPPAQALPSLSAGSVSPEYVDVGNAQTFQVTYTHSGNKAPTQRNVVIDGSNFAMTTSASTFSSGSTYTLTRTMTTSGEIPFHFEFSDGTNTARFPSSGSLTAYVGPAQNVAPTLSNGIVTPKAGGTETRFTFSVVYKDANNDAPVDPTAHVVVDGSVETHDLTCAGTSYYKGVTCSAETFIETTGTMGFHFTASDGETDTRLPGSGTTTGPVVADEPTEPPTESPTTSPTESPTGTPTEPVPTPGPGLFVVLAAIGALAVALRRHKE